MAAGVSHVVAPACHFRPSGQRRHVPHNARQPCCRQVVWLCFPGDRNTLPEHGNTLLAIRAATPNAQTVRFPCFPWQRSVQRRVPGSMHPASANAKPKLNLPSARFCTCQPSGETRSGTRVGSRGGGSQPYTVLSCSALLLLSVFYARRTNEQ
jgi:hypothetical protein